MQLRPVDIQYHDGILMQRTHKSMSCDAITTENTYVNTLSMLNRDVITV